MIDIIKRKYNNLVSDRQFNGILTGSIWTFGSRLLSLGLVMLTSIIIAQFYGAEMMGIIALINSFFTFATIFTVLGTNTSILRLLPEHLSKYSPTSAFKIYCKVQYLVAGVSLVIGTFLFLSSGFIANQIFSKPHLMKYFAITSAFIIFKSLTILNTDAVRGGHMIKAFAFMQLLPSVIKLVVLVLITFLFFHKDNPIYALIAAIVVTSLTGVLIVTWGLKRRSDTDDVVHRTSMREILSLSLPMLMTASMVFIIGQTGVVVMGIFWSEAEVGYYSVAVRLSTLTGFVLTSINSIAAAKFSELFHSDRMDELFYVAKKSTKLIFWATVPILLLLILFGKPLLSLLYGHDFRLAYWSMVVLIVGQFVNSISGSTGNLLNMVGHHKVLRNIVIIAAIINLMINDNYYSRLTTIKTPVSFTS